MVPSAKPKTAKLCPQNIMSFRAYWRTRKNIEVVCSCMGKYRRYLCILVEIILSFNSRGQRTFTNSFWQVPAFL
jgi:hypothetical protein